MILKKIFLIFLFGILSSCEYKPIYQKKVDLNTLIKKIQLVGDKNINRKIISFLNLQNNNISTGYTLLLDSKKNQQIISKDKSGNASVYRTTIIVKILLNNKEEVIRQKTFSLNSSYNVMTNKFDLLQYQKNIELSLIDQIADEIFIFLTL